MVETNETTNGKLQWKIIKTKTEKQDENKGDEPQQYYILPSSYMINAMNMMKWSKPKYDE